MERTIVVNIKICPMRGAGNEVDGCPANSRLQMPTALVALKWTIRQPKIAEKKLLSLPKKL
jgi:hypothetical protein